MTDSRKKLIPLWVFLSLISTHIHASQPPKKSSAQHEGLQKASIVKHYPLPKEPSAIVLSEKKLPLSLTGHDLTKTNRALTSVSAERSKVSFAGRHFTMHNFSSMHLAGVILTHTTCDYLQCFQKNAKKRKKRIGKWYLTHLPKDLKSITQVYPYIAQDHQKATLLQIASGLAYLPYEENLEFYIKIGHWSCQLVLLKIELGFPLNNQLVCSLFYQLNRDATNCCWKTDYPFYLEYPKGEQIASEWCRVATTFSLPGALKTLIQYYITDPLPKQHNNFDSYLKLFQEGISKYNVTSHIKWDYASYKTNIEKSIQSLKKNYAKISSPSLQKEACYIAWQLAQSYKKQYFQFLCHYLSCQNSLIDLKKSTKLNICYNWKVFYQNPT